MPANSEKPVTFGAVIEEPTKPQLALRPQNSNGSNMSATLEKDAGFDSSNPYSAFYKHPKARRSMDAASAPLSKTHLDVAGYERDLEAGSTPGLPLSAATTQQPKVSVDGRVKECTMWPSRQTITERRKMSKRAKGCKLFGGLTSKQRLWAKIVIALFVIAAAVGLGIGISKAVGGGIWKGDRQSGPIS
ncbi:hypothetical protein K458DRAFT_27251 [Lentithecium fluviatile CBS 122367]|uniref:Uncharacterized protein n=1 Tax=Lentithecium fluviatile CBS 122367 TaxID=1168545 RepID=A0A6G1J2R4_9PLEO|nr:hypothetical protein K458DRAFT_27251 [Lentithecium fluviatile CBS 122367]